MDGSGVLRMLRCVSRLPGVLSRTCRCNARGIAPGSGAAHPQNAKRCAAARGARYLIFTKAVRSFLLHTSRGPIVRERGARLEGRTTLAALAVAQTRSWLTWLTVYCNTCIAMGAQGTHDCAVNAWCKHRTGGGLAGNWGMQQSRPPGGWFVGERVSFPKVKHGCRQTLQSDF